MILLPQNVAIAALFCGTAVGALNIQNKNIFTLEQVMLNLEMMIIILGSLLKTFVKNVDNHECRICVFH